MPQISAYPKAPFNVSVSRAMFDVASFWIKTEDNIRLRIALWSPKKAETKGTIFLFQGRTENNEKYGLLANELNSKGYQVMGIDWRGQGLSDRLSQDRMLGDVKRYSDYQLDVKAMVDAANTLQLPKPWYLIGHSLGACVGLRALIDGLPMAACAFTAPLWDINLSKFQRMAAGPVTGAAIALGMAQSYAPGTRGESYVLTTPFEENRLTYDPEMYNYYIDISEKLAEQQIGGPSMRWLNRTLKETRDLAKLPPPALPCLTFCGAEDSIIALSAVKERMSDWPEGTFEHVAGAKHDVFHETKEVRAQTIQKVMDLFDMHRSR